MSVDQLETTIKNMAAKSSSRAGPNSVANTLLIFEHHILAGTKREINYAKTKLGYKDINQLRADYAGLTEKLRTELPKSDWKSYFDLETRKVDAERFRKALSQKLII